MSAVLELGEERGRAKAEDEGEVEEEMVELGVWEKVIGLVGWTGETAAMERGVGEEAAGVGVDGELFPPFCMGKERG